MASRTDESAELKRQLDVADALMGTVVERISSAESGLHEAFVSLLRGFEVREVIYIFWTIPHTLGVPYADSSP